jgi:hypothetical protein
MHRKDLGTYGEAFVITQCLERGLGVYQSYGDNNKSDFVVEDSKGVLHKVQVKTTNRESKSPECTLLYVTKSGPNYSYKYEEHQIDWFAILDMMTKKVAWVSKDILKEIDSCLTLRHTAPKNNQTKNIKMFDDYTSIPFE